MALVKAICSNCGAALSVDNSKEAAICEFCGTPYVVEKAINNYNMAYNIENANINVIDGRNIQTRKEAIEKLLLAKEWNTSKNFAESLINDFPEYYGGYIYLCRAITEDWTDCSFYGDDENKEYFDKQFKMVSILTPIDEFKIIQEKYNAYMFECQRLSDKRDKELIKLLGAILSLLIAVYFMMFRIF